MSSDSITAVDYLHQQLALEKEARELMPYDPNVCTYVLGSLRQQVYACLTCIERDGETSGICYSCSVQCHSSHTLVELFTKRGFTCDCGTTRMASNGACCLRTKLPGSRRSSAVGVDTKPVIRQEAEDVPSSSNVYCQNFRGKFCSCGREYNPVQETGNMLQCVLGDVCGEDWFHDECLMGYAPGTGRPPPIKREQDGVNRLDSLGEAGMEAADEASNEDPEPLDGFPDLDAFDCIICWKCYAKHKAVLDLLPEKIVYAKLPYVEAKSKDERAAKLSGEVKEETDDSSKKRRKVDYPLTIFLKDDFKESLQKALSGEAPEPLVKFLKQFPFLYTEDPVYEPPEDEDDDTSSIFDLGAKALNSLPREQAISGLQAYETIKSKLTTFLRPFAEEGKVVTEKEIRDFFEKEKNEM